MPRILELRKIGNEVWARLDIKGLPSPVTLYTQQELKEIEEERRKEIIFAIEHLDDIIWPHKMDPED